MAQGGYVSDIGYSAGFYPETAPAHMGFAQWCAGRAPPPPGRRMLELGFGQGFGLALLAAANPDMTFEGCDFNAAHVAHARGLAEAAGLTNLHLAQDDFLAMAARGGARDIDVVAAHGVVSWVARPIGEAALQVVGQRLRDGGMAMVSYNCLPGWAPLLPLRQLMRAARRASPAGSNETLGWALALLQGLRRGEAATFAQNPALCAEVDALAGMDPAYLAHEYFCEEAQPLAFAEMEDLAARAGLVYAGAATPSENFIGAGAAGSLPPALAAGADDSLRETLRDLMTNRRFRRDLYRLTPAGATAATSPSPDFILAVPPARIIADFPGAAENPARDLFAPLLARLAQGGASGDALAKLETCRDAAPAVLRQALAALVEAGQILPLLQPPAADFEPARRFNRMVVDRARRGLVFGHLASPVARTGVRIDDFGLMALAALFDGEAGDARRAGRYGLAMVKRLGGRPAENGVPIADDASAADFLAERLAPYVDDWFEVWRKLGAI